MIKLVSILVHPIVRSDDNEKFRRLLKSVRRMIRFGVYASNFSHTERAYLINRNKRTRINGQEGRYFVYSGKDKRGELI